LASERTLQSAAPARDSGKVFVQHPSLDVLDARDSLEVGTVEAQPITKARKEAITTRESI
jgi:hypothetical protein